MRINVTITITAGTPINLAVAMGLVPSAAVLATTGPIPANRLLIQMLHGGSGLGYVMDMSAFIAGTVPNHSTSGHLTMELGAASPTAPGQAYGDAVAGMPAGGAIDVTRIWVDGPNSADTLVATADLRR
jgi:hypothetical protein